MLDNGSFDPSLCPLLQSLSPEEIAVRMREEPVRTCMERLALHAEGHDLPGLGLCPALVTKTDAG